MKIGVFLEAGLPADRVAELGMLAEGFGIHTLWASSFPAHRDPFLSQAVLARESDSIRLGIVPLSPYEMHPMRISDALLTLNEMCKGRASLLVGGLGKSVMRATGLEPSRRITAVRECVEILKGASPDSMLNFTGEVYQLRGYQPVWATDPPPLVYVGSTGAKMLKMAGSVADGVMMSDVPLYRMDEVLGYLGQGLERSGRRLDQFRVNNFFAWHIKADKQAAIDEARMELVWRGILQKWHTEPFLGDEDSTFIEERWDAFLQAFIKRSPEIDGIPEPLIEALVENLTFTGDLDDLDRVIGHLTDFQAAGLDEITLKIHGDAAAAIRIIGEYVVPVLG